MGFTINFEIGQRTQEFLREIFSPKATDAKLDEILLELGTLKEQLQMSQQEVLDKIAELKNKVSSIGDQITAKLAELQAQIDAGQDTTATMAALNDLGTSLQGVDDLVPDLPPTP